MIEFSDVETRPRPHIKIEKIGGMEKFLNTYITIKYLQKYFMDFSYIRYYFEKKEKIYLYSSE